MKCHICDLEELRSLDGRKDGPTDKDNRQSDTDGQTQTDTRDADVDVCSNSCDNVPCWFSRHVLAFNSDFFRLSKQSV